jgi:hypothetical protein
MKNTMKLNKSDGIYLDEIKNEKRINFPEVIKNDLID